MDDAIEGSKELLAETVQAFKTGMRGEEYVPGSGGSPGLHLQEEFDRLDELRTSGTLTEEEFQAARSRLVHPTEQKDADH
ncbi:MAG: SHOCT domain-containing protein [Chloroflexota bacterium]|nr:MAG: hypothetical protein DLM70_14175 [Chloroflexota bacterium]